MSATTLQPGFDDPVAGAQSCFRAVLDAMSRPGRITSAGVGLVPPPPLAPSTAAVMLTLLDYDTPVWLDADASAARDWIAFHCGAPFVHDAAACGFAIATALPNLAHLPLGTHESPEQSATLVLQVAAMGAGRRYRLAGPGLKTPVLLAVDGLPGDFAARWQANHALFPRGVDLVLCAGNALTALPRSVTVQDA